MSVKKSEFSAWGDNALPDAGTIDFVNGGVNYKMTFGNFFKNLGVTGSIVQDGAATGTPVLDPQGTINNIRNLEPGKGIKAEVSPENGITLENDFTQPNTGIAIIADLTQDQYQFRSLLAGDGIQVAQVGDNIKITATGTPTSDKTLTTTTITMDAIINTSNDLTFVDATSNNITVTLPTAVSKTGINLYIKRVDDTTNQVKVIPTGSETIDDDSEIIITYNQCMYVVSDGTNWRIA